MMEKCMEHRGKLMDSEKKEYLKMKENQYKAKKKQKNTKQAKILRTILFCLISLFKFF